MFHPTKHDLSFDLAKLDLEELILVAGDAQAAVMQQIKDEIKDLDNSRESYWLSTHSDDPEKTELVRSHWLYDSERLGEYLISAGARLTRASKALHVLTGCRTRGEIRVIK